MVLVAMAVHTHKHLHPDLVAAPLTCASTVLASGVNNRSTLLIFGCWALRAAQAGQHVAAHVLSVLVHDCSQKFADGAGGDQQGLYLLLNLQPSVLQLGCHGSPEVVRGDTS